MVRALGGFSTATKLGNYAKDALYWLRRYFNDFELHPEAMEKITALSAPVFSPKVKKRCVWMDGIQILRRIELI